jgi:ATP phosphoribosyltransferase
MPIEITFLRTDDIPVLCAEGAIDMGITGGDLIEETGVNVTNRLALG